MCLSIPVKILQVKENTAIVDLGNKKAEMATQLMSGIKEGDYCLVSNGFIIKKISPKEAKEIFNIIKPKEEK